MYWLFLILAGIFEIGFATFFKLSDGFTNLKYSLAFLLCIGLSLFFLNKALEVLPLGTSYAIWTGIGAVGTVLMGIFFFKEPAALPKLFFLFLLISSIIGLEVVSGH